MTPGRSLAGFFFAGVAASLFAACSSRPEIVPAETSSPPTFRNDVEPFVSKYCIECHGIEAEESGLDLRTMESIRAGGDSGPAIVPGSPDESLLFEMIHDELMPPEGELPSAEEIERIRRWIADGGRP